MPTFSHLHCHTQFSLLDGAASIKNMVKKAHADNMPAVAITDHGNMFGVFEFVAEATKQGIKPIVGCEFYLVKDRHKRQFTKEERDRRYHQLFLAKNAEGYRNLVKICSLGFIEGLYGKYPRIDKELILKYHKGLIATTCCIGAEVPQAILTQGEAEAEKVFKWWLDIFGEDYYVELQRHGMGEQEKVNEVLLRFAKKYNVKIIATNDSHYIDQQDFNAHDILLCVNTGELQKTPVWKGDEDEKKPKGHRFGFFNDQFYFKNTNEMSKLFADVPQAIDNTNEIVGKVETLKLKQDILLPNYQIPEGFATQDDYLEHLTYEGARERYKEITPEVEDRLKFELFTIRTMGFAGYFLIVADFIKAGRDLGVFVGPGRGSAAGSAVAYCVGITNIDPIKYNLLFERFLNPDRKSMPDIDTDFDDEGRQRVIDYVVQKYGRNQVAQIATYGTMAAKMSIKDVARVLDLPLAEANALAKLVPDKPGIKLDRVMKAPLNQTDDSLEMKEKLNADDIENCRKLREIAQGTDTAAQVIKEALVLEGSVRGTGIHAAGIIIAPKDLTEIIPVATAKDSDLLVTQYEGKVIEDAGVIKMDFLGLKTLSIIRDALKLIKQNYEVEIEIDEIPLDDEKTYQLYQRGETNATFQFESAGMQKYLKDLKPDKFDDLIAMNALYRPGPLEYIPNFIARKHGREAIAYDLADMEEYLKETYGITVYQEQVMLLSQKLAGFTKGDADVLRKAMGKKDRKTLDKLKPQFIDNATTKGHDPKVLEKIWTDWEAFASYAFNKSHSTCYAFVAFQTAYLKAHYPEEYMAAVLTNSLGNIEKITFFLEECRRMGLLVLGPDINESLTTFGVNKQRQIRFGLGAIKGTGEAAVESIIEERNTGGAYKDIFDFATRVNLRTVNKKTFESLAYAGAFDCFGLHRAQYFAVAQGDTVTFIEKIIRYANQAAAEKAAAQVSLFGGGAGSSNTGFAPPNPPDCEVWGDLEKLKNEKEVVGFYISGHPLDQFLPDIQAFCTCGLDEVDKFKDVKELRVGGIVTKKVIKQSKTGNPFVLFSIEDHSATLELALFGQDYVKFGNYIEINRSLCIRGKMQPRYGSTDQHELKVIEMELLDEMRGKYCKSLNIKMNLDTLSLLHIDTLEQLAKSHQGTVQLNTELVSEDGSLRISMFSKAYKVNPSNELLYQLRGLEGVEYRLG